MPTRGRERPWSRSLASSQPERCGRCTKRSSRRIRSSTCPRATRRIPRPAVAPIASHPVAESVIRGVRKTVTALFVRIGVVAAGGGPLDPEAMRRVTGRAFGALEAAADGHGGTIAAVSGDAITAVFGLPLVHEDDALRAMRAAADARTCLFDLAATLGAERALQLNFRIGISTGEIVTGGTDAAQARATGEPLTLSQRLGDDAAPGEILIDAATRAVLRDAVTVESAPGGWRVLDAAAAASERVSRFDSPMVGRERERRRLQDAFDQAVTDRSCQLFTVLGVAGVGKSRLVDEFLRRPRRRHARRRRTLPPLRRGDHVLAAARGRQERGRARRRELAGRGSRDARTRSRRRAGRRADRPAGGRADRARRCRRRRRAIQLGGRAFRGPRASSARW